MKESRFKRSVGTYVCECCKRRTRPHSGNPDAFDVSLCDECYELAGVENAVLDGCAPTRAQCLALLCDLQRFDVDAVSLFPIVSDYVLGARD
jgi:hypothetical protein